MPDALEEEAVALLWEAGTSGVECKTPVAGDVELLAYFETATPDADVESLERKLAGCRVARVPVPEVDWVSRFRSSFRAFDASGFRIAPPWEAESNSRSERLIVLDPGRAFGTGTHETTRLCLAALADLARRRPLGRVLDVGTGTGILAVAARRLGAECAVGVDIDPEALAAAARHATLNRVDLLLVRGNGAGLVRRGHFDCVLANLSTALLCARRDDLLAACAPQSSLLLSGFLSDDLEQVVACYRAFGAMRTRIEGEWAALEIDRS